VHIHDLYGSKTKKKFKVHDQAKSEVF